MRYHSMHVTVHRTAALRLLLSLLCCTKHIQVQRMSGGCKCRHSLQTIVHSQYDVCRLAQTAWTSMLRWTVQYGGMHWRCGRVTRSC